MKTVFKQHGYPSHVIKKAFDVRNRKKDGTAQDTVNQNEANRTTYISLPYVKGLSEPIARVLKQHNIKTGHKSRTLRDHLMQVKDKVPSEMKKGTVYQIRCECGDSYIGESGRPN